jgi:hypothetical protein
MTLSEAVDMASPLALVALTIYKPLSDGLTCDMFSEMYPKLNIVLIRVPINQN